MTSWYKLQSSMIREFPLPLLIPGWSSWNGPVAHLLHPEIHMLRVSGHFHDIQHWWFQPTPLKNHGLWKSWDDEIPNCFWKVIKAMFQITNQSITSKWHAYASWYLPLPEANPPERRWIGSRTEFLHRAGNCEAVGRCECWKGLFTEEKSG